MISINSHPVKGSQTKGVGSALRVEVEAGDEFTCVHSAAGLENPARKCRLAVE